MEDKSFRILKLRSGNRSTKIKQTQFIADDVAKPSNPGSSYDARAPLPAIVFMCPTLTLLQCVVKLLYF
jgi:hypothetical protein